MNDTKKPIIKKMTRAKAIKLKCLECASTPKEVTICHLFDCPLWQYRTGQSLKSIVYRRRMNKALENYSKDIKELKDLGVDVSLYSK